jgi:hypothetical protein
MARHLNTLSPIPINEQNSPTRQGLYQKAFDNTIDAEPSDTAGAEFPNPTIPRGQAAG